MKPFPYQQRGIEWLVEGGPEKRPHLLLADSMGLGKSCQALLAVCALYRATGEVWKWQTKPQVLVICPAGVRRNWVREAAQWVPILPRQESKLLPDQSLYPGITVVSYEWAVSNFHHHALRGDVLILDEAHYLKSLNSQRSHAILGKGGLIHRFNRTWALTGTPTPNHLGDLWPWLFVTDRTSLTYDQFLQEYCVTREGTFGVQVLGTRADKKAAIAAMLKPVSLRRHKEDVLPDLPPVVMGELTLEAGEKDVIPAPYLPQDMEPIKRELQRFSNVLWDTLKPQEQLDMLASLAQSVSTLRRYVGLQKTPAYIRQLINEGADGAWEKKAIFAYHKDVIDWVHGSLPHTWQAQKLYGDTRAGDRERAILAFNTDPRCRVIVVQILAGGVGINLHLGGCHHVDLLEPSWVPGDNEQAVGRVHRIGQRDCVFGRYISLVGSIDVQVLKVLKRKALSFKGLEFGGGIMGKMRSTSSE